MGCVSIPPDKLEKLGKCICMLLKAGIAIGSICINLQSSSMAIQAFSGC